MDGTTDLVVVRPSPRASAIDLGIMGLERTINTLPFSPNREYTTRSAAPPYQAMSSELKTTLNHWKMQHAGPISTNFNAASGHSTHLIVPYRSAAAASRQNAPFATSSECVCISARRWYTHTRD